ncbi:hypothetical protein HDU98_009339 [Podochytrium sp. JEL0797]|nr:hypothetical protein HDU98_009339 [Podochytrium sp. JEL0797]
MSHLPSESALLINLSTTSLQSLTTTSTLSRLQPHDNSLLFSNDTSMVKPLSEILRDVDALSATNVLDETWRGVERDVVVQRRVLEEETRRVVVGELRRGRVVEMVEELQVGGRKSAFKKALKFVEGDVEDLIVKMNGLG